MSQWSRSSRPRLRMWSWNPKWTSSSPSGWDTSFCTSPCSTPYWLLATSGWFVFVSLFPSDRFRPSSLMDPWCPVQKEGGIIFPDKAVLYLTAIEDGDYKEEKINCECVAFVLLLLRNCERICRCPSPCVFSYLWMRPPSPGCGSTPPQILLSVGGVRGGMLCDVVTQP